MPDPLIELVDKIKTLGPVVISVVLYGSAASGDHHESFSDYNVLCVVRQLTPVELEQFEPVVRWWREQGNPSPLLLTEHELRTSTDCFAMEFHDMKENRRILYGSDPIADLAVDYSFYRAQVEYELRSKLLRLRQKASGILSDKEVLLRLLADSVSTFCVLFRHALILDGESVAAQKRDVIAAAGRQFGLETGPFETLLDVREKRVKPKDVTPNELLAVYLREIDRVIERVDVLEKNHRSA